MELYQEHKELKKEYDRQREKVKEAHAELKEKTKALMTQEKLVEDKTAQLL